MEKSKDTLLSLIDFLRAHGYPDDSFVMEWPIGKGYRVDLAIVDPDTNKAVALFELKRQRTEESIAMALRQAETFSDVLGKEQVPTYIVFGKSDEPYFEIYYVQKDIIDTSKRQPVKIEKVPDFSIFKSSKIIQAISQTEEKQEKTLSIFKNVCWVAASIVFVLLFLDFVDIIDITAERLALIGVIAGLIIIPFASKLKILGFEFERLKEKKKSTQ